jgi:hypothetical protein
MPPFDYFLSILVTSPPQKPGTSMWELMLALLVSFPLVTVLSTGPTMQCC